jgi:hypothetical protein
VIDIDAADEVWVDSGARRDTVPRAAVWCLGLCLTASLGLSTVTLGRECVVSIDVVGPCAVAVPFSTEINNAIDEPATARLDGIFTTISSNAQASLYSRLFNLQG